MMTFSRGFPAGAGDAGAFLRMAARTIPAALMVTATSALLWAAPAAVLASRGPARDPRHITELAPTSGLPLP